MKNTTIYVYQFSHSVVSDSATHGLQHARPPCPSPAPGACSNSCPSNHLILCHPLLLLPSIFPSVRVFSRSQCFESDGQSIGASATQKYTLFMCINSMKQMLNEGTSRKRTEEELGSSWGSSMTARRSVCTGPEGSVGFQWVKREKGVSGELPAPGREVKIPKPRVHVLMPAFFFSCFFPHGKKPQDLSGSLE